MAVEPLTDEEMRAALFEAKTPEEARQITLLRREVNRRQLAEAVRNFIDGTMVYLELIEKLEENIRTIGFAPGLDMLLKRANEIHIELAASGMRKAGDSSGTDPIVSKPDKPITAWPKVKEITKQPVASNSTSYDKLKDEYINYFVGMQFVSEREPNIAWHAQKALEHRSRYEGLASRLAIPWWFIAGVHALEASFNTKTHLHNGDPLTARTVHVPKGRPTAGTPPFSWTESAADALTEQELANLSDWSLPRALWRWERYNGFGYRKHGVPSPYLWSFSTVYEKGKFTSDGRYSASKVSEQCGVAVLLRYLHREGQVELDIDRAVAASKDSDVVTPFDDTRDLGRFGAWWSETLPHIVHFGPHELLTKGGAHAKNGLNTDPPEELWGNAVPLVETLEAVRKAFGKRLRLSSVYRSPAYNKAIGGATKSQHMRFTAADFTVEGISPGEVHAAVAGMRDRGLFHGGLGRYKTFTHLDVRGHNVSW
jgi:lysozyme family protein